MTLFAMLIALPVVEVILPYFSQLSGKSLQLSLFSNDSALAMAFGLLIPLAWLAGSYPAVYLSGLNPIQVIKGRGASGRQPRFRQVLVIFQFAVAIFLVVATIVISRQLNFFRQERLNLGHEVIVSIPLRGNDVFGKYTEYKNDILQNTSVLGAAASSHIPFTENKSGV